MEIEIRECGGLKQWRVYMMLSHMLIQELQALHIYLDNIQINSSRCNVKQSCVRVCVCKYLHKKKVGVLRKVIIPLLLVKKPRSFQ